MNKYLNNPEFLKDKAKYYLVLKLLNSEHLLLRTDSTNYVLCRGEVGYPTWVWTKDNLQEKKLVELKEVFNEYLTGNEDKFTAKEEVYDYLANDGGYNLGDAHKMGTLLCTNPVKPNPCDGYLDHARESDLELLAKYWYDDHQEMRFATPLTKESAYQDVSTWPSNNDLYVWRNDDGLVVAFVGVQFLDDLAKLGPVYTAPAYRRQGYCANTVYEVTNNLVNQGYQVCLYTDYEYVPSNNAYKKVGFKDTGYLVNFRMQKKRG